jgi:signal transduction histidine kinase
VRRGDGAAPPLLPGPGWQGPVSSDIAGSTFDFRAGAESCRRYATNGELITVPRPLLDPALAARWGVKEAVIASIDSDAVSGWLVIPKRTTEADLYLARAVAVQLVATLDNATAAETWRAAAASEERLRVAHDLHDGILQFLTGLALQLRLMERQVSKDPEAVVERIRTVAAALREEQQDLRRLLEDIRPRRTTSESAGPKLSALVPTLATQWDIRIEAGIANEPPADIADDVRLITREAVANAVRHGRARLVSVAGRSDETGYQLSIRDNGCGMGASGRYSAAMLRADAARERAPIPDSVRALTRRAVKVTA